MSNIHDMEFLQKKVQELKEQGLYKELVTLEGPSDAECIKRLLTFHPTTI